MVEQLFQLSRRQALRLMVEVQPHHPGRATQLERGALLAYLDGLLARRPVQGEIERRRQLRASLTALEREAAARTTPVLPAPPSPALALPEGVALLAPGRLEIRFASAEELLGRVLALAERAAGDFPSFKTCLESP